MTTPNRLFKFLKIIGLFVLLHSCSMLPHGSHPTSITTINKPVYDSVVRVSVPVQAAVGVASQPGFVFGDNNSPNTLLTGCFEAGVGLSAKQFSLGASAFYYTGKNWNYIQSSVISGYEGNGFRANASFDKTYKFSGGVGTWRIVNLQATLNNERGTYGSLRDSTVSNNSNYTYTNTASGIGNHLGLLLYSEFAFNRPNRNTQGALALGFSFYFSKHDEQWGILYAQEQLATPWSSLAIIPNGMFMSYRHQWKQFYVMGSVTLNSISTPVLLLSGAISQVNLSLGIGYSFQLK